MGLDFLNKAAPAYHKSLDRRKVELGTPTLFTQQPVRASRTYSAKLIRGQMVSSGECLQVRLSGDQVVVIRDFAVVAVLCSPPSELIEALRDSHNEACGTIQVVHDDAEIAEVAVC